MVLAKVGSNATLLVFLSTPELQKICLQRKFEGGVTTIRKVIQERCNFLGAGCRGLEKELLRIWRWADRFSNLACKVFMEAEARHVALAA